MYRSIKKLPIAGCMQVQVFERNKALQEQLLKQDYRWVTLPQGGTFNVDKKVLGWTAEKVIFWADDITEIRSEEFKFEDYFNVERSIPVDIKLFFGANDRAVDLTTNDVPKSLIVERLQVLTKALCQQIVAEAKVEVKEEDVTAYLDGIISTDREKLKLMLE